MIDVSCVKPVAHNSKSTVKETRHIARTSITSQTTISLHYYFFGKIGWKLRFSPYEQCRNLIRSTVSCNELLWRRHKEGILNYAVFVKKSKEWCITAYEKKFGCGQLFLIYTLFMTFKAKKCTVANNMTREQTTASARLIFDFIFVRIKKWRNIFI